MHDRVQSPAKPVTAEKSRDMQAALYREIGISAVAAALRFTTQPEPQARQAKIDASAMPGGLAA